MVCLGNTAGNIATVSSVLRLKLSGFELMFADILIKKSLPILFDSMDCCTYFK